MKRLRTFQHLAVQTPDGPRLIDAARGRPVPDGPEEYVRQDVLHSLVEEYGYPMESLLAEEQVARGTKNKRRADVLVELPAVQVAGHSVETLPAASQVRPLTDQLASVERELGRSDAMRLLQCPSEIDIVFDGRKVACHLLGFMERRGGIAAALAPAAPTTHGLPAQLCLQVIGLNLRDVEVRLANQLGLPRVRFDSQANMALSQEAASRLSAFGLCHPFNKGVNYDQGIGGALSETGREGWIVLRPSDAPHGVLAHVDTGSSAWPRLAESRDSIVHEPSLHAEDSVWRRAARLDIPTRTFIVVECKALDVAFSAQVLDQGLDYATTRDAQYLVLTSGVSGWTRSYQIIQGRPHEVEDIPDYSQATSDEAFRVRKVAPQPAHVPLPPDAEQRPDLQVAHARTRDAVGADLPPTHWCAVLRVDDALCDPSFDLAAPLEAIGFTMLGDRGQNWHETKHTAGKIPARYRDWLVRGGDGDEVLVGATMRALRAVRNHHSWKNMRSKSSLMGATPHGATVRNEVEYNMGSAKLDPGSGQLSFLHDGRMAKGGGGFHDKLAVLQYMRDRVPQLVHSDRILLGTLPAHTAPSPSELQAEAPSGLQARSKDSKGADFAPEVRALEEINGSLEKLTSAQVDRKLTEVARKLGDGTRPTRQHAGAGAQPLSGARRPGC